MAELERLFDEFRAAFEAGEQPDPRDFLERVDEDERQALVERIDSYLMAAPPRPFDPEAYAGSPAERAVRRVDLAMRGVSGRWPTVLPRLRERAQLRRAELVGRLAAALGAEGREEKVDRYYHEMEHGLLPAEGVADRVLAAIGEIVGESAEALRHAGRSLEPGEGPGEAGPVMARRAFEAAEGAPPAQASPAAGPAEEEEWDEVDELFRGGRDVRSSDG